MAARRAGGAWLQRAPLAAAAGGPHGPTPLALEHDHLLTQCDTLHKQMPSHGSPLFRFDLYCAGTEHAPIILASSRHASFPEVATHYILHAQPARLSRLSGLDGR